MYVCMYVRTVCMYVCMYVCVSVYLCTYVCLCLKLYSFLAEFVISALHWIMLALSQLLPCMQPPPDPTANLTFSLTLTEREKGDRAKAPLPYVKSELEKQQLLRRAGSGAIFYTPDDADDFDDSDPDDDLDI